MGEKKEVFQEFGKNDKSAYKTLTQYNTSILRTINEKN
jgi:hypothetical protein